MKLSKGKVKAMVVGFIAGTLTLASSILFQNCSEISSSGFSSLQATNSRGSLSGEAELSSQSPISENGSLQFPVEQYTEGGSAASNSSSSSDLIFIDNTYGDSTIVLRQVQKIIGAKTSLLRACTGPAASFTATTCTQDSAFRYISESPGWQYDRYGDIYSIDIDVSQFKWPNTTYTVVILFPNGVKKSINFKPVTYDDTSYGNGSIVVRQRATLVGFGKDLKGCTVPLNNYHKACALENDFSYIKNTEGWSYNDANDTYSIDLDVTNKNYPQTNYFTKLITSAGRRYTIFKEINTNSVMLSSGSTSSGTYKWSYTQVNFCVSPSTSPAPIGQPCSIPGQTATNACGTATCQ